ncbi:MAG: sensor histidine kinase [Runella sp.]
MTKQRIRLIIFLIGAAMMSMVGFQWYWIANALLLRNEQFDLKVADALQEVVRKLEKQEIIHLIHQREAIEEQQRQLATLNKTRVAQKPANAQQTLPEAYIAARQYNGGMILMEINRTDALLPRHRSMPDFQAHIINDMLRQRTNELPHIEKFLKMHAEQEKIFETWFEQMERSIIASDSTVRMPTLRASLKKIQQTSTSQPSSSFSGSTFKAQHLKDIFKDLLFSKRPVEERINRFVLDSLLRKSLYERGISIGYEFAIRNSAHQTILFSTNSFEADHSRTPLFSATLFPNEINNIPSQLLVYFPERRSFILHNMGFLLASSLALLLVFLGCFYVAVSTIIKQKKLSDIKNDFINNMTHEFKTPLSTISLAVNMAHEHTASAHSPHHHLQRYLGIIQAETQRLGNHVEKVLQMALLDRGEIKLRPTSVHIHDLLERVLNHFSLQLEQRNADITLQLEAEQEIIEADEVHLTNILTNLIDNATKYSPDSLCLHIATQSDESSIKISVSDRGQGMTPEQLSKIFEPFYRVPTGNLHDVKGFGLGLSYVKKMIEAHGGSIEVKSKPKEGSTFTIYLPVCMTQPKKQRLYS